MDCNTITLFFNCDAPSLLLILVLSLPSRCLPVVAVIVSIAARVGFCLTKLHISGPRCKIKGATRFTRIRSRRRNLHKHENFRVSS